MTLHTPHINFTSRQELYYPIRIRALANYGEPSWCYGWGIFGNSPQRWQCLKHLTKFRHE